jgi:hypothetical protein
MRWDNPIIPDWFAFPDLASFPDYAEEPRNTTAFDNSELHDALIDGDYQEFISIVKRYTGNVNWLGKLQTYFKHVLTYRCDSIQLKSNACWTDLFERGIHVTSLDMPDFGALSKAQALLKKPDWNPQPGTYDRGEFLDGNVFAAIEARFRNAGIMDAVDAYSGKPRHVTAAYLHVSTPTDKHYKQFFMDATTTPRWTNLHIDPKENVMKAIIYMDDIGLDNGPFGYLPESNRYRFHPLQEIFGRAISTGNYCKTPEERKSVFALPSELRVSYNFGRCVMDGSDLDRELSERFMPVTSDMGNVMIFDAGAGMHQGGLVREGRRVSLQVLMK